MNPAAVPASDAMAWRRGSFAHASRATGGVPDAQLSDAELAQGR